MRRRFRQFFDLVGKMAEAEADQKTDDESESAPSLIAKAVTTGMSAPPPYSEAYPYSHVSISPAGPTGNELAVLAPKFEPGDTEPIMVFTAMTVSNNSRENVLFKIKINFSKAHCTLKPCFGRLLPGESEEILVTLKVLPWPSMMDLDWCIKVYDTVDILSTSEDAPQNARVIWSEIDDRVAYVSKTLIPIRFVGAAPAESDSDGVPSNYSPRCNRVAAALRSFPTPPAPPPTPIPLQRPKSSPLDRKVRMRSFAKDPAHTENINEPTFLEEVATSIVKIERDASISEKTIHDLMMDPDKLPSSLKPSLEESLSGSRSDANNNEKDDHMKEDLEDVKRAVTEIKYLLFLVSAIVALRVFGFF